MIEKKVIVEHRSAKRTKSSFSEYLLEKGDFFRIIVYLSIHFSLIILMCSLGKIAILQAFTKMSDTTAYILIGAISIITGFLAAFIFNKINETKKYIIYGVIYSSILAVIFAVNNGIKNAITKLFGIPQFMTDVAQSGCSGLITAVDYMTTNIFNTTIGFTIALIMFNIPFIIYYIRKEEQNWLLFLLYLIPIIIYIIMAYLLIGIGNFIIGQYYLI